MNKRTGALILGWGLITVGCFGARNLMRSYYVLSAEPVEPARLTIDGLVRVRNMDADRVYEKFQLVVRKSPYELRYSTANVWAVKPSEMVSDIVAVTLEDTKTFIAATTELGETRPNYIMSGDLYAVEIYDSGDVWHAHLAVSLRLTSFKTGDTLWTMSFDKKKPVQPDNYAQAARALSELLGEAMSRMVDELSLRGTLEVAREAEPTKAPILPERDEADGPEPFFVPEGSEPAIPPPKVSADAGIDAPDASR